MSRLLTLVSAPVFALVIGSAIAASNFAGSTMAPAYVTKADFDQAFADAAAGRREGDAMTREKFVARSSAAASINRDRKGDRSPRLGADAAGSDASGNPTVIRMNAVSPELAKGATSARNDIGEGQPAAKPVRARHCEPVASPFADPALGRIIGRCFV